MIEKHVTSLELSKRLKELGVKQESLFAWSWHCGEYHLAFIAETYFTEKPEEIAGENFSAFLASELGEMLPSEVHQKYKRNIDYWKTENSWNAWLPDRESMIGIHAEKETDMRAKLLIHLIEQGIIKP